MMSFGNPLVLAPLVDTTMVIPTFPRIHRPFSVDEFMDLDRQFGDLWSSMDPIINSIRSNIDKPGITSGTSAATQQQQQQIHQPSKDQQHQWSDLSSTFKSISRGDHTASLRTVRMKDRSGRDELLEERCLDDRISRRKTDLSKGLSGTETLTAAKPIDLAGDVQGGKDVSGKRMMALNEFDKLWDQDPMVGQFLKEQTERVKRIKPSKQQKQQSLQQQQPQSLQQQQQRSLQQQQQQQTQIPVTTTPTPSASSKAEFSSQLNQLAQLGMPCDASAIRLLQHTHGSVERTVIGLLCLKRMRELGVGDVGRCVDALCAADLELDKACDLVKRSMA